ncbi:MAG: 30S ribosomal protein S17 [Planctomycetes bacterium]|nr:30S ribosomal protein S17 [Planctomycetota bacterium]NOG54823.1 30S ribosomal protein S17 [Planctomycetota bacterium]
MTPATSTTESSGKIHGSKFGVVDRARADKTRRVIIEFQARHPKYGKYIKRSSALAVHDENNISQVGDKVELMPCRPMSKTKQWTIVRVVEQAAERQA